MSPKPSKPKTDAPVDQQKQQRAAKAKLRKNQKAKDKKPAAKKTKKKTVGKEAMKNALTVVEPSGPGRPTELTPDLMERLVQGVGDGHFVQAVMQAEGLSRTDYYHWVARGEDDRAKGQTETIYAQFLNTIKKAEFAAEDKNLKLLQDGGFGWQANAWFLERRFPGRWGNRLKFSMEDAKDFMRKFLTVVSQHIPDREVLKKIVLEAQKIEGEARELATAGK